MTAPSDAREKRARVSRARQAEFEPVYHFYGPHRAGLPPLIPYFRELWRRRAFAAEMSRADANRSVGGSGGLAAAGLAGSYGGSRANSIETGR